MHFGVSAPSVHQIVVRLTELGLIERTPYAARSIRVLLPEDQMPAAVAAREAAANPSLKPKGPRPPYTARQGQTAPSVHLMIVTLTRRGFIERISYTPRSIRILLPPELLPQLEM
jgi:SOS-response transcriptional repressor LexA